MDPVDILSFSVTVAQMIRSSRDPEATLAAGFRLVATPPPDPTEPFAVRVARLVTAAGVDRRNLLDHLQAHSGPLPLNRKLADPNAELVEPDAEAVRLLEYVEQNEGEGVSIFGECPFRYFNIATRSAGGFYEGEDPEHDPLPASVRCLIDYPLEVPVLFTIEAEKGWWNLWDICLAITDQYVRVYEQAERYGVWGHDLTDLAIENLLYYRRERLIYPHIGS
jgi:hypothetical protein